MCVFMRMFVSVCVCVCVCVLMCMSTYACVHVSFSLGMDSCFYCIVGKEYVCVIRLHDSIESEALLAQVSVV